jgi:hypothetical protein
MTHPLEHPRLFSPLAVPMTDNPRHFHEYEKDYKRHSVEDLESIRAWYEGVFDTQSAIKEEKEKFKKAFFASEPFPVPYTPFDNACDASYSAGRLKLDATGMIAFMNHMIKRKTN